MGEFLSALGALFDIFPVDGSDIAGIVAALAAVAGAIVSLKLYLQSKRPDVVAYLEYNPDKMAIALVVRNFGNGIAKDVRVLNLSPSLVKPEFRDVAMNGFVSKGIPMLIPGGSRRTIVCDTDYAKTLDDEAVESVSVSYKRKTAFGRWKTEEAGDFDLDFYSFLNVIRTESDIHQMKRGIESIAKSLKAISGSTCEAETDGVPPA